MLKPFSRLPSSLLDVQSYLVISITALLLVAGLISNHKGALEAHRQLAQQSAKAVAAQIDLKLAEQSRGMSILVDTYGDLMHRLSDDPENPELLGKLEENFSKRFPYLNAISLSDISGHLITDDFGEKVGDLCRADLHRFAEGDPRPATIIHPGPSIYHYDLRFSWSQGGRQGILFASFKPQPIVDIIKLHANSTNRLVVVRHSDPSLIEIDGNGSRDRMDGNHTLSPEDLDLLKQHGGETSAKNVDWRVVSLPQRDWLAAQTQTLFLQIAVICAAYLFLLHLTYKQVQLRRKAEQHLRETNEQLEERIAERTRKLVESEARASMIIENAPEGMLVTDREGRIETLNGLAINLFGYSREELIGQPVEMLLPEAMRDKHRQHRANYHRQSYDIFQRILTSGEHLLGVINDSQDVAGGCFRSCCRVWFFVLFLLRTVTFKARCGDLLIAAHAIAEDCTLTSADRAFTKVPGLRVLDWSAPLNPPD